MGGGQEAKRRRALKRAGLDAEAAAARAAKELAEERAAKQKAQADGVPAPKKEKTESQKERQKRKRQAKLEADVDVHVARVREQPLSKKKLKRQSAEATAAETEEPSTKKVKGDPRLTVFVGQLPFTVDARTLEEHFVKCGVEDVVEVRILTERGTNQSRGMAFVQLASEQDLEAALALHQSELCGRWINVERSQKGLSPDERYEMRRSKELAKDDVHLDRALSVFVAKMPYDADKQAVKEHFESGGVTGVTKVKMLSEKGTNRKGMAFVQLSDEAGVLAALELDQSQMGKRSIVVERSNKEDAKEKATAANAAADAKDAKKANVSKKFEESDQAEEEEE